MLTDDKKCYKWEMKASKTTGNASVAVGYIRVSTDDQHLGTEAQRAAIEKWAQARGVVIAGWHVDQGIGGGTDLERRPALQAALDNLRAKDAGVLVVAKRDRLARDVVLAALIERLADKAGAKVISAAGEGGEDADDPSSMLMRRIVDAFAEYERALIRSRTRAALGVKKKRGERTGTVPFGFRVAADGSQLEPDAHEQAIIARVRDLRASGVSVRRVVATLAQAGAVGRSGQPLCKAAVENIMRRAA